MGDPFSAAAPATSLRDLLTRASSPERLPQESRKKARLKSARARFSNLIAVAGVLGFGVAATPALGQTHTLNLSGPSTAAVGQPIIIQASGSNEQEPIVDFSSYLTVVAIPTSVLSACPADYSSAKQVAQSTSAQGGEVLDQFHREEEDAAGNFSMPVAYTPRTPGRFLICGYTDDAATTTLAKASLTLTVGGSAGSGPDPVAEPASVKRPRVRRSGRKLVCQRGSWSNNPSRYSYRWFVNGKRKRGARRRTLGISRKLRGRKVQCRVTARNAAGSATALSRPLRIR